MIPLRRELERVIKTFRMIELNTESFILLIRRVNFHAKHPKIVVLNSLSSTFWWVSVYHLLFDQKNEWLKVEMIIDHRSIDKFHILTDSCEKKGCQKINHFRNVIW